MTYDQEICFRYGGETDRGVIVFRSPFYSLACKHIGIKWNRLTRTGKMVLKSQAIDILNEGSNY